MALRANATRAIEEMVQGRVSLRKAVIPAQQPGRVMGSEMEVSDGSEMGSEMEVSDGSELVKRESRKGVKLFYILFLYFIKLLLTIKL